MRDGARSRFIQVTQNLPFFIHGRTETSHGSRAIHVMPHIFLATPDQFNRRTTGFHCNHNCLQHHIHLKTAPKAATQKAHMQMDVLSGNTCLLSSDVNGNTRYLRRHPQIQLSILKLCRAIHGLHRGMSKERRTIFSGNCFAAVFFRQSSLCITTLVVRKTVFRVELLCQFFKNYITDNWLCGPASHSTAKTPIAFFAVQYELATTAAPATALSLRSFDKSTTCKTPGIADTDLSSILLIFPPMVGLNLSAA